MKRNIKYQILAGIVFVAFLINGCDERNDLGLNLLPSTDLISVNSVVLKV